MALSPNLPPLRSPDERHDPMTQQQPTYSGASPWVPAFPGQRPPFQPGNTLAMSHGAHVPALVRPMALQIADGMASDGSLPQYLREPTYRPALLALCTTLARVERLQAWLERTATDGVPLELDEDGQIRGAAKMLLDMEVRADKQRAQLGLTPLSRARLGKDVAAAQVSILDVWAEADRQAAQEAADGPVAVSVPTAEGVTR